MDQPFNIIDIFNRTAAQYPEKIALIEGSRSITFCQFQSEIEATAGCMQQKGLGKGDRVMVFIPMSIALYRSVLAIFKIGATAVFLDEWVNRSRLEECCRIAECKGFIGTWKIRTLALLSRELRKIPVWIGTNFTPGAVPAPISPTYADDHALITFTTGSTGTPKAAARTHGLLHEQLKALTRIIAPQKNEISMPLLPVVLLINLAHGTTSVISRVKSGRISRVKINKLAEQITQQEVSTLIASPFVVKQLALYSKNKPVTLKKIFTGGAPVFPEEARIYRDAFPEAAIRIVYGSTEAEPMADISADELLRHDQNDLMEGLHVGKPDPIAEIRIVRISDGPIVLTAEQTLDAYTTSRGEIGEIIVSGPHVLRSYLGNEQAIQRNKIFIGNQCWHRTGDSGFFDTNGQLRLTGRCSTLIQNGEEITAPFIYEGFFQSIPGVEIATILPYGMGVAFILELNDPTQQRNVRQAIENKIKLRGEIIFVKKIPRDPRHHSKIDYDQLKQILVKHRILIKEQQ